MTGLAEPRRPDGWRIGPRGVAAFLIAAAVLACVMPCVRPSRGETGVLALAAQRMIAGEQIYRPEDGAAFTYPPFFTLPFVPLVAFSEPVYRRLWYFSNFCLLGGIVWIVARMCGPVYEDSLRRTGARPWMVGLILAVLSGRFLISPIEYQSHDLIVVFLVLLAVQSTANGRSGSWAGLAAACKATPALLFPMFVWQRRWRAAAAFAVAALAATLLPDLIYPAADGQLWAVTWYETFVAKVEVGAPASAAGAWVSENHLNQSLAGMLYRWFDLAGAWGPGPAVRKLLIAAAQLSVVGFLAWVTWPRPQSDDAAERAFRRLGEGSALLCGMLLLSPMSSKQHFCALYPPIAFCVVGWLAAGRRDRVLCAALLSLFVCGTLLAKDIAGRRLGNLSLVYGSMTWCTLICLLASGHILVRRARRFACEAVPRAAASRSANRTAA